MEKILIIERNIVSVHCCKFLNEKGFQTTKIDISNTPNYNPETFTNKLSNIFCRLFFNKKDYHYNAEKKFYKEKRSLLVHQILKQNKTKFDKIIVIRPDYLTHRTIKELSESGSEMVGYFWDAIPVRDALYVLKSIHYFSNLYSYDKKDIERYKFLNLKFITNFYYPIKKNKEKQSPRQLYYLGNITTERRDIILEKIISKINHKDQYKWNIKFNIYPKKQYSLVNNNQIKYIDKATDYIYHLEEMITSYLVFDINPTYNNGLSFRFFEALYYKTKIITTNKNVLEYDFFNDKNILVYTDTTTEDEINSFIEIPYEEIDESIIEKYRIDNWISNLFS